MPDFFGFIPGSQTQGFALTSVYEAPPYSSPPMLKEHSKAVLCSSSSGAADIKRAAFRKRRGITPMHKSCLQPISLQLDAKQAA
jgi:hypothetical protein